MKCIRSIAAITAAAGLAVFCQAAEPATTGEARQSLDGTWQFTIDPAAVEQNAGTWETMAVPGNWDTHAAYSKHQGKGWYRRTFTVPPAWKGKCLRLRFEAANFEANVTLNGKPLGSHVGGYTPFEFDVTDKVSHSSPNTLVVCVDNTYHRGAWWNWGGLSRSVNLIANNGQRIVWQHVRTEPDLATGTARVFIQYLIHNSGSQAVAARVTAAVSGLDGAAAATDVTLAPGGNTKVDLNFNLAKSAVRLWDFDHPNLYTIQSRLAADNKTLHALTDRFGIRKVEVREDGLYLNGEHIRVPGFNRVSDSLETGNTEPDALVRKDVDMMKSAGAVMSRLMHYPQAPNLLDYLDEKGMLIFCEIPVWGSDDPDVRADNPRTKQWLAEMVARDYNHPCIIGWSPGNEIANHFDYVRTMNAYIRTELDPHRLVSYISNTGHRGNANPQNDPITFNDIAMINSYGKGTGSYVGISRTLRSRWPDKPVFYSEYGVKQIGGGADATVPGIEEIWKGISMEPYAIGGSLWTFNDYRSGFKGTPPSGNREWGVVDVHRNPKAAYQQIRKLYCPVRSLAIANDKIRLEPRSPKEIPSYTLRGYKIQWVVRATNGTIKSSGLINLPEIKPGAPIIEMPLPSAAVSEIHLVSPTGYQVSDFQR